MMFIVPPRPCGHRLEDKKKRNEAKQTRVADDSDVPISYCLSSPVRKRQKCPKR